MLRARLWQKPTIMFNQICSHFTTIHTCRSKYITDLDTQGSRQLFIVGDYPGNEQR